MQCRHITRLQLTGSDVVLFGLVQLWLLIVAEGPIIERLKMWVIEFNCLGVVGNRMFIISIFAVCEPPIVIEVSFARFKLNSDRKTFDCLFEVRFPYCSRWRRFGAQPVSLRCSHLSPTQTTRVYHRRNHGWTTPWNGMGIFLRPACSIESQVGSRLACAPNNP